MTTTVDVMEDFLSFLKQKSGADLQSPALLKAIKAFEAAHATSLPEDFSRYLRKTNGFDQSKKYQDINGFNFLPLQDIRQASAYEDGKYNFKGAERYYIFCDYLDFSWAYAIQFGDRTSERVLLIGAADGKPHQVAESFSAFLRMYLIEDSRLFPN